MTQIITFQTAKLAKEKGFDEVVKQYYFNKKKELVLFNKTALKDNIGYRNSETLDIVAPTQSLLQKWFREVHNIDVTVTPYGEVDIMIDDAPLEKAYAVRVDNWNVRWSVHDGTGLVLPEHYHFDDVNYEEALEKGLYKALELL